MGNSEVGHMNLGAGRIVYQDLVKINLAIENNTLKDEQELVAAFKYAKENNKPVHFLGLVSDGGVHSHINHLFGLVDAANNSGVEQSFIHAFTDGRDVGPKSGFGFITSLENHIKDTKTKLASVTGRYFAMDRDKRWERVKLAYDAIVNGIGEYSKNATDSIQSSYDDDVTDEFIKPIIMVDDNNNPVTKIQSGDVVVFFNFRTDRGRELTEALSQNDFHEQNMHKLDLYYVTFTNYDDSYKGIKVVYNKDNLTETLGEVLEKHHKKQIRIAETEKYPHVTFFFSGGRETPFNGEQRLMVNSPKVATYDLQPEMSSEEVTTSIITEIEKNETDFICLNFANPDMVGHTGVYSAIVTAVEKIDSCTQRVVETGLKNDYSFIIIADHGNADFAINAD